MDDNENRLTTVQIDTETSAKLGALAKANKRSKAAQVEWMVEREFAALTESASGDAVADVSAGTDLRVGVDRRRAVVVTDGGV